MFKLHTQSIIVAHVVEFLFFWSRSEQNVPENVPGIGMEVARFFHFKNGGEGLFSKSKIGEVVMAIFTEQ